MLFVRYQFPLIAAIFTRYRSFSDSGNGGYSEISFRLSRLKTKPHLLQANVMSLHLNEINKFVQTFIGH